MAYTNAVFYVDDGSVSLAPGDNAPRPTLSAVVFSNPASTTVRGTYTGHGLITGAVVNVDGTTNYDGDWKITVITANTFDLDTAVWSGGADLTGDVVPFGGSSWADAWATNKPYPFQHQPGADVRFARSGSPASIGNALWSTGPTGSNANIVSSTNTSPVVVTVTAHGYASGDFVYVRNHSINTSANGLWRIINITTDTFELEGSVGVGVGAASGQIRRVTSSVVYLDTAQTANVDTCDANMTGLTGLLEKQAQFAPSDTAMFFDAAGTGYTAGDILTVTGGGGSGATLEVLTVGGGGDVATFEVVTHGKDYTVGSGITTSGGTGAGATLQIDYVWDVVVGSGNYITEGVGSVRVDRVSELPGTPHAFSTFASKNLSAYQKLSLQIAVSYADVGAGITADEWEICLCSDTAGVTVVDVFKIPAITASGTGGQFRPITIAKEGGGNLGAAIQSVLVRAGTEASPSMAKIHIDNIIACTTSGLNLQSLVSKTGSEQGTDHPWFALRSINGRILTLDHWCSGDITNWSTYYGTTENVATYKREAIKIPWVTGVEGQDLGNTNGTDGNHVTYSGGWNVSTGLRTGVTIYDGLSGEGVGIDAGGTNSVTIEGFGVYRFVTGFNNSYDISNTDTAVLLFAASHCSENGIAFDGYGCTLTAEHVRHNEDHGILMGAAVRCLIDGAACVSNKWGVHLSEYADRNEFRNLEVRANEVAGIQSLGSDNVVYGLQSSDNGGAVTYVYLRKLILVDTDLAEITDTVPLLDVDQQYVRADARLQSHNHDLSGYHKHYVDQGVINSEASDRTGGQGPMWSSAITGVAAFLRNVFYPITLELAQIAVDPDVPLTVTAWMRKDHATNIRGRLVCRGGQVAGVASTVYDELDNDTTWQELTITVTPTERGVVTIEKWAFTDVMSPGGAKVFVDDLSVTQED